MAVRDGDLEHDVLTHEDAIDVRSQRRKCRATDDAFDLTPDQRFGSILKRAE
jgi:hypothetical protein